MLSSTEIANIPIYHNINTITPITDQVFSQMGIRSETPPSLENRKKNILADHPLSSKEFHHLKIQIDYSQYPDNAPKGLLRAAVGVTRFVKGFLNLVPTGLCLINVAFTTVNLFTGNFLCFLVHRDQLGYANAGQRFLQSFVMIGLGLTISIGDMASAFSDKLGHDIECGSRIPMQNRVNNLGKIDKIP